MSCTVGDERVVLFLWLRAQVVGYSFCQELRFGFWSLSSLENEIDDHSQYHSTWID